MAAKISIVNVDASTAHQTYSVSFFNDEVHTTVTSDAGTVTKWINQIDHPNLLTAGLGIHFRHPDDLTGTTIELCVGGRCLIYQLDLIVVDHHPEALLNFLHYEGYTFVGVGIFPDVKRLNDDHAIYIPEKNLLDLRQLTVYNYCGPRDLREYKFHQTGLRELAEVVLEKEVEDLAPESVMLRRWDFRRLTSEQVRHACVKAFVSFEIGRVLNAREYNYRSLRS
ncbi:hypothetical protein CDL12_02271 [Handroanthus impetiginosus]|uniref:Uncharacterized protein n=1 Tax=Handroanthus impetiginosus TaxID=429701 RepID=A0A2G9I5I0_9LAMI|nr:hypothetical protein CDL12_02271 [Handroanthus impetiginosus]